MLYKIAILFFISFDSSAKIISAELQHCMTQALLTTHHSKKSLEAKRIGQGDRAVSKEFRILIQQSTPAPYTKHTKAKTIQEAKEMSRGKDGKAQYLPGINNKALEKSALMDKEGFYKHFSDEDHNNGKGGTFYKYVKFDKVIGYEGGTETQWMRVEWSSGQFHGHPINIERLHSQCPTCFSKH